MVKAQGQLVMVRSKDKPPALLHWEATDYSLELRAPRSGILRPGKASPTPLLSTGHLIPCFTLPGAQKHGSERIAPTPPPSIKAMCKREWLVKGLITSVTDTHIVLHNVAVKGPDSEETIGKIVIEKRNSRARLPGCQSQLLHLPAACHRVTT